MIIILNIQSTFPRPVLGVLSGGSDVCPPTLGQDRIRLGCGTCSGQWNMGGNDTGHLQAGARGALHSCVITSPLLKNCVSQSRTQPHRGSRGAEPQLSCAIGETGVRNKPCGANL